MRGELKRKSTRTVHGKKVVRLRIDIPYHRIESESEGDYDILQWLDVHVNSDIDLQLGAFNDENQTEIDEILGGDEDPLPDPGTHTPDLGE